MFEEFNYLEETHRHSPDRSSAAWARCIVAGTCPSYEDARKRAEKNGKKLTKGQYEKACRDLGLMR